MSRLASLFTIPLVLCSGVVAHASSLPNYIAPSHSHAVNTWLNHHPKYRLAVDSDCSCSEDLVRIRAGYDADGWPAVPDYHPYYVTGDFRGDGGKDVALGVICNLHPEKFRVLIISGQHSSTFLSEELDLRQGLFYGPPRPKPWRLVVGPFESEGVTFEPTPNGYKLSDSDSE